MSRLPTPDPGWEESTEGDLDADLTEEAGSSLDDWSHEGGGRSTVLRVVAALTLVAVLAGVLAQVVLAR